LRASDLIKEIAHKTSVAPCSPVVVIYDVLLMWKFWTVRWIFL